MNWGAVSALCSLSTLLVVAGFAFRWGRWAGTLEQLVKDINEKGCMLRRNSVCQPEAKR